MIRHLILLDDALDPITDAHLYAASHDDGVKGARVIQERGVQPYAEVEIENPGWGVYAPGEPRALAIVTSEDGTMATAKVLARGWLNAPPTAFGGDTVTLHVECVQKDIDLALELAAAEVIGATAQIEDEFTEKTVTVDPTADNLPFSDRLWGKLQKTSLDILQGRDAWWDFDVLTHDITLREHAAVGRILNIGDGYDPSSLQAVDGFAPAKQVRLRVHVNFTTQSTGICDISPRLGTLTSLLGYQTAAPLSLAANVGWTFGTPRVALGTYETAHLWTGLHWDAVLRKIYYVDHISDATGLPEGKDTEYSHTWTAGYEPWVTLQGQYIRFLSYPCTWNYNQVRRETIDMTLDVPCQDVYGVKDFLHMGEMTLGDVYTIDGIDASALDQTADYQADDYVYENGRVYKATADVTGFYEWKPARVTKKNLAGGSWVQKAAWVDTGIDVPVSQLDTLTFIGLPRGLGSLAHGFLRMRQKALEALASYRVQIAVEHEDCPDVELTDRVRILLPGKVGEAMKPAIGRVVKIERQLGHDGDRVALTLAIPVGTGVKGTARPAALPGMAGAGYFGGGYRALPTGWYTAGPDIEWTLDADDIHAPVDPRLLPSALYSVLEVETYGSAAQQAAQFQDAAAQGLDAVESLATPTNVGLGLRPLKSEKLIERMARAHGTLLAAEQGLDFATNGEPAPWLA